MREVLTLSYDAGAAAILVSVAATKESEHVPGTLVRQLGLADPQACFPLDRLPPKHAKAFQELLAFVLVETERLHAKAAADPNAVAERAAAVAKSEFNLLTKETAARDTLAAIQSEIDKKRAELEELERTSTRVDESEAPVMTTGSETGS